jgi:hypothetical protein
MSSDKPVNNLGGDVRGLSLFTPLSEPAKLGYVAPLGRNNSLDVGYSALTPEESLFPLDVPLSVRQSDASQVGQTSSTAAGTTTPPDPPSGGAGDGPGGDGPGPGGPGPGGPGDAGE